MKNGRISLTFIVLMLVLIIILALTGDVWKTALFDASQTADMSGMTAWFFENFVAVILGIGTLIMFVLGAIAIGGDD